MPEGDGVFGVGVTTTLPILLGAFEASAVKWYSLRGGIVYETLELLTAPTRTATGDGTLPEDCPKNWNVPVS